MRIQPSGSGATAAEAVPEAQDRCPDSRIRLIAKKRNGMESAGLTRENPREEFVLEKRQLGQCVALDGAHCPGRRHIECGRQPMLLKPGVAAAHEIDDSGGIEGEMFRDISRDEAGVETVAQAVDAIHSMPPAMAGEFIPALLEAMEHGDPGRCPARAWHHQQGRRADAVCLSRARSPDLSSSVSGMTCVPRRVSESCQC